MDWQGMRDLTTQFLSNEDIGDTNFNRLLLLSQRKYEAKRNWRMLRGVSNRQTVSASPTTSIYLTPFQLPSLAAGDPGDFGRFSNERPVVLKDSSGNETELRQIPIEARQAYYNIFGYFYVDFFNNKLYLTGNPTLTYTLIINYKIKPPALIKGLTWWANEDYHAILPLDIAIGYKGGIDYDVTNAAQNNQHERDLKELWDAMVYWDAEMDVDALKGLDRRVDGGYVFQSGQLPNTNQ